MAKFEWKSTHGRDRAQRPAGALNAFEYPAPRVDLAALSLVELTSEFLARLAVGETLERDQDLVLASQLLDLLDGRLDVHLNRFSRRRYYDLLQPILDRLTLDEIRGATVVDLGAGSLNPFAFGFIFLMLGARRAYAVDLDPVQDAERAVRALATAAGWLLIDPERVTGRHAIAPGRVIENLAGFDLGKLAAGSSEGIAADRLVYLSESIETLSLSDGEADLVSSVSLLEHVSNADDVVESLWRITKPGGLGHHVVDFVDHRLYGRQVESPFEFLTIASTESIVHGCNRMRCGQWRTLFESSGFIVERVEPCRRDPLTDAEQRRFVEPYRSMAREDLMTTCARFIVRRP